MFAALVKAAIFYWVFIMIRRLLKSSGILSDKKKHSGSYSYTSQEKTQQQFKDDDVIEADYRVID